MGIHQLCLIPEHDRRIIRATTHQIQNEQGGMKRHPDRTHRNKEKGSIGSVKMNQPRATVSFSNTYLN